VVEAPPPAGGEGGGSGKRVADVLREAAPFLHLGWTVCACVALGALAGYGLDALASGGVDGGRAFTVAGAIAGVGAGIHHFVRAARLTGTRLPPRTGTPP